MSEIGVTFTNPNMAEYKHDLRVGHEPGQPGVRFYIVEAGKPQRAMYLSPEEVENFITLLRYQLLENPYVKEPSDS